MNHKEDNELTEDAAWCRLSQTVYLKLTAKLYQ